MNLSNASDLFNFLITVHRSDHADDRAETAHSINQIKENYQKIISSRSIAGALNEILKSAGHLPPEGSEGSPISKLGLSVFLGNLANKITAEHHIVLDHDALSPRTLNMRQFNEDLISITQGNTFSAVFSGWMLPLIYKNKKAI